MIGMKKLEIAYWVRGDARLLRKRRKSWRRIRSWFTVPQSRTFSTYSAVLSPFFSSWRCFPSLKWSFSHRTTRNRASRKVTFLRRSRLLIWAKPLRVVASRQSCRIRKAFRLYSSAVKIMASQRCLVRGYFSMTPQIQMWHRHSNNFKQVVTRRRLSGN